MSFPVDNIRKACADNGITLAELEKELGIGNGVIARWSKNKSTPPIDRLIQIAKRLGVTVAQLSGTASPIPSVGIDEDTVTFSIIGDIAAGYDHIATADWDSENIDIPRSWLHGHPQTDFFTLRVKGDSMYPIYQDGDIVLVKRQATLNRSGEIGVIIYGDDHATLKKVEYVMGEDWMRLIPINPNFKPEMVVGEDLEHCRVLGFPVKLIRNIE